MFQNWLWQWLFILKTIDLYNINGGLHRIWITSHWRDHKQKSKQTLLNLQKKKNVPSKAKAEVDIATQRLTCLSTVIRSSIARATVACLVLLPVPLSLLRPWCLQEEHLSSEPLGDKGVVQSFVTSTRRGPCAPEHTVWKSRCGEKQIQGSEKFSPGEPVWSLKEWVQRNRVDAAPLGAPRKIWLK
jgi:hypothetical protein